MTEQQWNECQEPAALLRFLRAVNHWNERQLRLFACHCCRRLGPLLTRAGSREALELAEQEARGLAPRPVLYHAYDLAATALRDLSRSEIPLEVREAAQAAKSATMVCLEWECHRLAGIVARSAPLGWVGECAWQCHLLRDLFGPLPFRPVVVDPTFLGWNESVVRRLAEVLSVEGAFHRLPLLADALEEAGCTSKDLLDHLRGPGPHYHGCWALAVVLGRS